MFFITQYFITVKLMHRIFVIKFNTSNKIKRIRQNILLLVNCRFNLICLKRSDDNSFGCISLFKTAY